MFNKFHNDSSYMETNKPFRKEYKAWRVRLRSKAVFYHNTEKHPMNGCGKIPTQFTGTSFTVEANSTAPVEAWTIAIA